MLLPNTPQVLLLDPFEIYEVLVPVDSLEVDMQYNIKKSFTAASATDTILKRKKVKYVGEDFHIHERLAFSMGLAHHRWSAQFKIDADGHYTDDPTQQLYEILSPEADSRKYLVFVLTSMKAVMAFDEETLFSATEVALELIPEYQKDARQRMSTPLFCIVVCVVCILTFIVTVYCTLMPAHIKNKVFGLANAHKLR